MQTDKYGERICNFKKIFEDLDREFATAEHM